MTSTMQTTADASPEVSSAASPLQLIYSPILKDLPEVERILHREMRSDDPYVDEMVRYGCLLGGKRLRPALLLLAARACGEVRPEHYTLGAVVEMIHTATLIHDDILDGASTRRNLATVNSRWDNKASVLLGDFLFTHAFYLASTLETTWACRVIGRATNVVCEGELRQNGSCGDFQMSEEKYLSVIDAKTAALCACSSQIGAYFAGADASLVEDLEAYGREVGVAFQIADDLLDVLGKEEETGKSLGTDLEQLKPTLPLIRVLQCLQGTEKAEFVSLLENQPENRQEIVAPYLERFEALEYTRRTAQRYAAKAASRLERLPQSPALDSLRLIAEFVTVRSS